MREDTVLSLKWHSFPSHLAVSLDTCYEKQQFVDLSLVCKDGTILKCHKMVLANSSSFFRRLLVANDHPHPMIILHDIEADDLKTIINFMYCGEIQVVQSEVRRLLKLAEILEVTGLRHIQTSVLPGELNNASQEIPRKTPAVPRYKIEDTKSLPSKTIPDHEINAKPQNKPSQHTTRFVSSSHSYAPKGMHKLPQESTKRIEESNINVLSQRLETGRSGISIVDINDMPSTSRRLPNPPPVKRKDASEITIGWPQILSAISKDSQIPLKRLCVMDEVEITAQKPPIPTTEGKQNEPLDRRKNDSSENQRAMNFDVVIKDELDISSDMDEDIDMDPLKVDDTENETANIATPIRLFSYPTNIDHTSFNSTSFSEFPSRKNSNG